MFQKLGLQDRPVVVHPDRIEVPGVLMTDVARKHTSAANVHFAYLLSRSICPTPTQEKVSDFSKRMGFDGTPVKLCRSGKVCNGKPRGLCVEWFVAIFSTTLELILLAVVEKCVFDKDDENVKLGGFC